MARLGARRPVIVYAESSAVVTWLVGEPRADAVSDVFRSAERVVTSLLTRAECRRAVLRGAALNRLTKRESEELLERLAVAESAWDRIEVSERILDGAAREFPVEPVRTLNAIHLASAYLAHVAVGGVVMLSFDARVRTNAAALGMQVLPAERTA